MEHLILFLYAVSKRVVVTRHILEVCLLKDMVLSTAEIGLSYIITLRNYIIEFLIVVIETYSNLTSLVLKVVLTSH